MTNDWFSGKAATKAANRVPESLLPNPKARLKDQFHEVVRFKHLSLRTEEAYWEWIVRYLKFHRERTGTWRHPRDLGTTGVTPFLTDLAVQGMSASTQNLALNALLFLHREVLHLRFVPGDFERVSSHARRIATVSKSVRQSQFATTCQNFAETRQNLCS